MVLQYWRENKYENYTLCKCIAILEEEKIGKLYTLCKDVEILEKIGKLYTIQRYFNIVKNWKNINSAKVLQYWREKKYENYTLCKAIAILEKYTLCIRY